MSDRDRGYNVVTAGESELSPSTRTRKADSDSTHPVSASEAMDHTLTDAGSNPVIIKPADFNQMLDTSGLPMESAQVDETDFCTPRPSAGDGNGPAKLKGRARLEAWLESLVARSPFVQSILSRIYLPLAFHSGLRMKKIDANTFTYVLPFRRFNKNWYKAMAGASLVANTEIAAGLYLMGQLKGRWTVVCREMNYRFLRPCFGPAIYRITPEHDIGQMMALGNEFNVNLVVDILQQVSHMSLKRQPKVGRCNITFHVTPKGPEGNYRMHRRHLLRMHKEQEQTPNS